jgi:hypothetical protein
MMITTTEQLKKKDWVTLRLLYLILASDPSAAALPDVSKAIALYGYRTLLEAFELLNREIANDGKTFGNPEVNLTRYVEANGRRDGLDT